MVLRKLDSYMQKNELDHHITLYTKINSEGIKDFEWRSKTIKRL